MTIIINHGNQFMGRKCNSIKFQLVEYRLYFENPNYVLHNLITKCKLKLPLNPSVNNFKTILDS